MRILSIALIFSFFLLSIFYFLPSVAHANTIPQANNYPAANTNPDVPNNPHFSTQSTVIEIMSAITCQISGIDPLNPKGSCLGADPKTGKIGFLPSPQAGGAIGAMGNMISMLYTPPLHTADYFQNLAQNFGIAKKTYAQTTGTGFEGLKPLIGLWTAFRNIVYLVFVIVFIVIGLAIMLRIKIDPRTVMTIQNQIPKIIIGILLVTFSYAVSGFLIDLMYTSIHLVGNIIASTDTKMASVTTNVSTSTNPFAAANRSVGLVGVLKKPATAIGGELQDMLKDTIGGKIFTSIVGGIAGSFIVSAIPDNAEGLLGIASKAKKNIFKRIGDKVAPILGRLGGALGGTLATLATGGAGATIGADVGKFLGQNLASFGAGAALSYVTGPYIISGLVTIIVFLVLAIAMLAALFRLWFTLLMAYIHILLDVVFAPFWIIGGIVPGSPINISGWFRDIIANLAAFPVVIAMFLLGKVFQDAIGDGNVAHFVPPLIGDRLSPDAIKGFISLGIILITPNILTVIKTALKVPKLDTGGGKAIGVGLGAPMEILNKGGSLGLTLSGLSSIPGINSLPIINKIRGGAKGPGH